MHAAAHGIHARHHVLDRAVLAGGVHRLKDEEQAPAILRVQLALQVRELRGRALERRARVVLGMQSDVGCGIVIRQPKSLALGDDAFLQLHTCPAKYASTSSAHFAPTIALNSSRVARRTPARLPNAVSSAFRRRAPTPGI